MSAIGGVQLLQLVVRDTFARGAGWIGGKKKYYAVRDEIAIFHTCFKCMGCVKDEERLQSNGRDEKYAKQGDRFTRNFLIIIVTSTAKTEAVFCFYVSYSYSATEHNIIINKTLYSE